MEYTVAELPKRRCFRGFALVGKDLATFLVVFGIDNGKEEEGKGINWRG